jgi:peptide/nickel transport system permease protein
MVVSWLRRAILTWGSVIWRGNLGRVGSLLLLCAVVVALFGHLFAPYPPLQIGVGLPGSEPSLEHLLGTDQLGRDVLSRVLSGGSSILVTSLLATVVAFAIGATIGMVLGYRGGVIDAVGTRLIDLGLTLPPLLLVLLLVSSLGNSTGVLVLVIALFFSPRIARIIRGATQAECSKDYVLAAKARGEGLFSIVFVEILPNITGPILAEFALRFTFAAMFISTLDYLGLGAVPPTPDWGLMISEGQTLLTTVPLAVIAPAIAIAALTVGANLISAEISSHLSRGTSVSGLV